LKGYEKVASVVEKTEAPPATSVEPAQAAPPKVVRPKLKRSQAFLSDSGDKLMFNAWFTEADKVDQNSVTLLVSVDKKSQKQVTMSKAADDKFSASMPFTRSSTGSESQNIEYTVVSGDTLGKIAKKLLGSSKKYMLIATMNNIDNPNVIHIGQKLRLKTGETKVTEVNYSVSAKSTAGEMIKGGKKTKFIY